MSCILYNYAFCIVSVYSFRPLCNNILFKQVLIVFVFIIIIYHVILTSLHFIFSILKKSHIQFEEQRMWLLHLVYYMFVVWCCMSFMIFNIFSSWNLVRSEGKDAIVIIITFSYFLNWALLPRACDAVYIVSFSSETDRLISVRSTHICT